MRPDELLRKLKRKFGKDLEVVKHRGKGAHRMIYLNGYRTTLQQDGDLGPGTVKKFLGQLNLKPEDLE
jgi:hypothetical protein